MPRSHPSGGDRRTALVVATVSFATLLLEIALTRLFSVVLFYHFAFLAISIALLGLGAGGVLAYIRRDWLARWSVAQIATRVCLLQAVAVLVGLMVIVRVSVTPQLTMANMLSLTLVYAAAAPPFVGTGLLFAVIFARRSARIAQLYGADLAGGAVACLAVVPLLNRLGTPNAVLLAALALGIAALLCSMTAGERSISAAVSLGVVVLLTVNHNGRVLDVVCAKGIARDSQRVEYARWNAISRIEVLRGEQDRMILIDADAATIIANADLTSWKQWRPLGYPLMASSPAVANVLRPSGAFAIIGPGGGVDVLRAVAMGSPSVTGIEINPIIVDDIMRGRYADFSRRLYELPQVQVHVGDGRSFIRSVDERYDVLQMTLVDTWATTAAGAFALSENGLYTLEAFREYFDHLRPDGILAITRWEFSKPREALRVVSQAMATLLGMGVDKRELPRHFIVVSDGPLNLDGRMVTVLAKRSAFDSREEDIVRAHVAANPRLTVIYVPSSAAYANVFASLLHSGDPVAFAAEYPFDISPVTDDSPFFFFTFKTAKLWKSVISPAEHGVDWKVNLGVVILGMVLAISLIAVAAFLFLPLAFHTHARGADFLTMLYFAAVGLGYILVEIAFIQRFVLFLGHPTYALTVVVFLMLLASGVGSFLSTRWPGRAGSRLVVVLLIIGGGIMLHAWLLPGLLGSHVSRVFSVKLAMCALLLVPLALVMGMPFPVGLRSLSERVAVGEGSPGAIEWAWAMNAAASVLGSVLAMVVAIYAGLTATLLAGALAYTVAALSSASFHRR